MRLPGFVANAMVTNEGHHSLFAPGGHRDGKILPRSWHYWLASDPWTGTGDHSDLGLRTTRPTEARAGRGHAAWQRSPGLQREELRVCDYALQGIPRTVWQSQGGSLGSFWSRARPFGKPGARLWRRRRTTP